MLGILKNLIPLLNGRTPSRFGRRGAFGPKRGGMAMGSLLSLAAPFVIRKLMARRHRSAGGY